MYSMVLMMAVSSGGDTASFGGRRGGCDGNAGCHGEVVATAPAGCRGGDSCQGGGFLGLRNRGGCHGGTSCSGYVAPVAVGCRGGDSCHGGGFLGLRNRGGSSCHGVVAAPACAPAACATPCPTPCASPCASPCSTHAMPCGGAVTNYAPAMHHGAMPCALPAHGGVVIHPAAPAEPVKEMPKPVEPKKDEPKKMTVAPTAPVLVAVK